MSDLHTKFSENLKREMCLSGLTVRELSLKMRISTVCIQHWRNGRWLPKIPQAHSPRENLQSQRGKPFSMSLQ